MTMTQAAAKPPAPIERTEHPHVVKSADTLGGQPYVENARVGVLQLFRLYEAGTSPAEIVEMYPLLSLAEVHDAISYAYDHLDEMRLWEGEQSLRSVLRRHDLVFVDRTHRLIPRARLRPEDVPPGATAYTWETLPEELA